MKISLIHVNIYRGSSPTEWYVEAQLEDEALGDGTWRRGQMIRTEGKGAETRSDIEALIKDALDRLETYA